MIVDITNLLTFPARIPHGTFRVDIYESSIKDFVFDEMKDENSRMTMSMRGTPVLFTVWPPLHPRARQSTLAPPGIVSNKVNLQYVQNRSSRTPYYTIP